MSEKQKLFIVDDSELNRDILKEILGSSYDYLEAENGTQAIQILEVHPEIDLMLLTNGYQYAADEWIPGVGTYEGVTVD